MAVDVTEAFRFVDLAGVLCNGALGATIARQRHFDFVGFTVLGVVSGLAGGVLRDVLLQVGRPVALTDPAYLVTAMVGVLAAQLILMEGRLWRWPMIGADALALGAWAATGTIKAQSAGLDWLPSLFIGVVTGVGGGMVRDICIGQVPAVLGGNTLYATAAAAASGAILLTPASIRGTWGMALGILIGGGLTLLARWRRWKLPVDPDVHLSADQLRALIRRSERAGAKAEKKRARAKAAGEQARPDQVPPGQARPDLAQPDMAQPDMARPAERPEVAEHGDSEHGDPRPGNSGPGKWGHADPAPPS